MTISPLPLTVAEPTSRRNSSPVPEEFSLELSIVMPCLNEAETLASCIKKAQRWLNRNHVAGEIIIADNGSTDGSQIIATVLGARVVDIEEKGYGSALRGGIEAAQRKVRHHGRRR